MRSGLDLGDPQVLKRYDRWRSLDNLMVSGVSDSVIRLFGLPGGTASAVRRLGMGIIEIGRAHVLTPVTNAHLVCRLLLEKKKKTKKMTSKQIQRTYKINISN